MVICSTEYGLKLKSAFPPIFIWESENETPKRLQNCRANTSSNCKSFAHAPMQLGDYETTKRVVLHHARCVILQHKEEIQKLAYK